MDQDIYIDENNKLIIKDSARWPGGGYYPGNYRYGGYAFHVQQQPDKTWVACSVIEVGAVGFGLDRDFACKRALAILLKRPLDYFT